MNAPDRKTAPAEILLPREIFLLAPHASTDPDREHLNHIQIKRTTEACFRCTSTNGHYLLQFDVKDAWLESDWPAGCAAIYVHRTAAEPLAKEKGTRYAVPYSTGVHFPDIDYLMKGIKARALGKIGLDGKYIETIGRFFGALQRARGIRGNASASGLTFAFHGEHGPALIAPPAGSAISDAMALLMPIRL